MTFEIGRFLVIPSRIEKKRGKRKNNIEKKARGEKRAGGGAYTSSDP